MDGSKLALDVRFFVEQTLPGSQELLENRLDRFSFSHGCG